MTEFLDLLVKILISAAISGIIFLPIVNFMMKRFLRPNPKFIAFVPGKDNWICIKKNPLPNDCIKKTTYGFLSQEIMITDGIEVQTTTSLRYNEKGNPTLDYGRGDEITHWQPMPLPPKLSRGVVIGKNPLDLSDIRDAK